MLMICVNVPLQISRGIFSMAKSYSTNAHDLKK